LRHGGGERTLGMLRCLRAERQLAGRLTSTASTKRID
jgi:hypothetical protein